MGRDSNRILENIETHKAPLTYSHERTYVKKAKFTVSRRLDIKLNGSFHPVWGNISI